LEDAIDGGPVLDICETGDNGSSSRLWLSVRAWPGWALWNDRLGESMVDRCGSVMSASPCWTAVSKEGFGVWFDICEMGTDRVGDTPRDPDRIWIEASSVGAGIVLSDGRGES
jgi:hypothetical protein